jgi:hypothetical protein
MLGTLKYEWDRSSGAAQDCVTFDRFLAEVGPSIRATAEPAAGVTRIDHAVAQM